MSTLAFFRMVDILEKKVTDKAIWDEVSGICTALKDGIGNMNEQIGFLKEEIRKRHENIFNMDKDTAYVRSGQYNLLLETMYSLENAVHVCMELLDVETVEELEALKNFNYTEGATKGSEEEERNRYLISVFAIWVFLLSSKRKLNSVLNMYNDIRVIGAVTSIIKGIALSFDSTALQTFNEQVQKTLLSQDEGSLYALIKKVFADEGLKTFKNKQRNDQKFLQKIDANFGYAGRTLAMMEKKTLTNAGAFSAGCTDFTVDKNGKMKCKANKCPEGGEVVLEFDGSDLNLYNFPKLVDMCKTHKAFSVTTGGDYGGSDAGAAKADDK